MNTKLTRASKIANEIAKELGITDKRTILEMMADISGYILMNPDLPDDEVACDMFFQL
jgi:hypothetical protein